MTKEQKVELKSEIKRVAKMSHWPSMNVIIPFIYEHVNDVFDFYISPNDFIETGKEVLAEI